MKSGANQKIIKIALIIIIVISTLITFSVVIPGVVITMEKSAQTDSVIEAKNLTTILLVYAMDHDGKFPPTLEELFDKPTPEMDKLLYEKGTKKPRWIYHPEGLSLNNSNAILLETLPDKTGGRIVAHINGTANYIRAKKNQNPPSTNP